MVTESDIQNVSETAMWIAAYRAEETEREDAAFKDPYARILAGERGFKMVASTPHTEAMAFAMIVRTSAIDQLVLSAINKGVDTVINLGAGLDTRPYRLPVPSGTLWIEVDFPAIISYKEKKLSEAKPVCRLERLASDLTNDTERKILFHKLSLQTSKALIITEGLVGYLRNDQAEKLSKDLFETTSFKYWIMDYAQGKLRKRKQTKDLAKKLKNAPIQFNSADPIGYFAKHGWSVCENIFILDHADKINRKLPPMFPWTLLMKIFPKHLRKIANQTYGYVLFEK